LFEDVIDMTQEEIWLILSVQNNYKICYLHWSYNLFCIC